ncbi:hypothetical protein I546_3004 [Mycobacterium kansasii 732]|nr:hypothetical protein I546_3004 [Mycobacterium kansasii 732]
MRLVNDVFFRSLGCLALGTPWLCFRHADTAPSLKPLVMAGNRGMSHVLTVSAVMGVVSSVR